VTKIAHRAIGFSLLLHRLAWSTGRLPTILFLEIKNFLTNDMFLLKNPYVLGVKFSRLNLSNKKKKQSPYCMYVGSFAVEVHTLGKNRMNFMRPLYYVCMYLNMKGAAECM
jgi:hypothetical protein